MTKGIYAILLELPASAVFRTRRKEFQLDAGFYVYIGSAMNGLEIRISRHLSSEKRKHWHIDYLLEQSNIIHVVSSEASKRHECVIAAALEVFPSIPGFGCSDCRCQSHLFCYQSSGDLFKAVVSAFQQAGLSPALN
ncbi:MAG: GIY-YIG nuclease family protein [Dehalogenimonas sp.]